MSKNICYEFIQQHQQPKKHKQNPAMINAGTPCHYSAAHYRQTAICNSQRDKTRAANNTMQQPVSHCHTSGCVLLQWHTSARIHRSCACPGKLYLEKLSRIIHTSDTTRQPSRQVTSTTLNPKHISAQYYKRPNKNLVRALFRIRIGIDIPELHRKKGDGHQKWVSSTPCS